MHTPTVKTGISFATQWSFALALLLCVESGFAAQPMETVSSTVDAVIGTLQQQDISPEAKKRKIRAIIAEHFDFRAMASRVLAINWKKASAREKSEFTGLFRELLTNTYWRKISGYQDETVAYVGEQLKGDNLATVRTIIQTATVDIPVDYKLYRKEDGTWSAYDVVIEQVSLVRNYRGSFQQIVRDNGIGGLINQLEVKVAKSSIPENP